MSDNKYMPFGVAIEYMKRGDRITREGWNGKGMYLYMVKSARTCVPMRTADLYNTEDPMVEPKIMTQRPYIAMKTVDDEIVPWTASQTDILANDWMVIQ